MQVAGVKSFSHTFNGKEDNPAWSADAVVQDYGFRLYSTGIGRFLSVDPMTAERSWVSPYNFVQNSPIWRVDPNGALDTSYYNSSGDYLWTKTAPGQDVIAQLGEDGSISGTYELSDRRDILGVKRGEFKSLIIHSESSLSEEMVRNGSTDPDNIANAWTYIWNESRQIYVDGTLTEGCLDHWATSPLVSLSTLHVVKGQSLTQDGIAYNPKNFGNFLWGMAGRNLGFGLGTLALGAHWNNFWDSSVQNPSETWMPFDSRDDQFSIEAGYIYPAKLRQIDFQGLSISNRLRVWPY